MAALLSWTDRSDTEIGDCCGGCVGDEEIVARLTRADDWDNGIISAGLFSRKILRKPKSPADINNACGARSGESLQRVNGLSDEAISALSARILGGGAHGAGTSSAGSVRAIKAICSDLQAFYIYEDPLEGDERHAVLRFNEYVDQTKFAIARDLLLQLFTQVEPLP